MNGISPTFRLSRGNARSTPHLEKQLCKSDKLRSYLQLSAFAPARRDASLYPMLGLFGIFGRSHDLKRLDQALRGVGLHPQLVPEAGTLSGLGSSPGFNLAVAAAAELLGYCILGAQEFTQHNNSGLTESVEQRLTAALEAGDSLDARVVLLTLHASIIQPSVVEHFGLRTG